MDKLFFDKDGHVLEIKGEKRTEARFPVCIAVGYGDNEEGAGTDFIINIGKTGVFIMTKSPLEPGAMVALRFLLPPEELIRSTFEGVVVGVNRDEPKFPKGMHVKFTGASPEDLERLERFLEEKKSVSDSGEKPGP